MNGRATRVSNRGIDRNREQSPSPTEISVAEAARLITDHRDMVIIDTRTEGAFSLGHIKGARSMALDGVEERLSELACDANTPVLLYCAVGVRSVNSVEDLRNRGYMRTFSLAGGYSAWRAAGYDTTSNSRLNARQAERYSRNILLKEIGEDGQLKLMNAKVLLVGAGGLASSAGLYLAACGVGNLGIVDFDRVDPSTDIRKRKPCLHRSQKRTGRL